MRSANASWLLVLAVNASAVSTSSMLFAETEIEQNVIVAGTVEDAETGQPLPFANLTILGTLEGAVADVNGAFVLPGLPPGEYRVQATYVGYVDRVRVVAIPLEATRDGGFSVVFELLPEPFQHTVIEVIADDVISKEAEWGHTVTLTEIRDLPVDSVEEALALKPGVMLTDDGFHIRGGRALEVVAEVDGIPVRDPIGESSFSMSTVALQTANVLTGGFGAEHGDAQSGVIQYETREGKEFFAGEVRYMTDDFGAPDRTFTNFDRLSLGFGGPIAMPGYGRISGLTYFVSYEGTFNDTYLRTAEGRPSATVLDLVSIGQRQTADTKLQAKLAYKISPNVKATYEILSNNRRWDDYNHRWSRDGFVMIEDIVDADGNASRRHGRFQTFRPTGEDGVDYEVFNAPSHTPNHTDQFRQHKVVLRHTLGPDFFYNVRLSHVRFRTDRSVGSKNPWQYQQQSPRYWLNDIDNESETFFVSNGDFPVHYTRDNATFLVKTDWTKQTGRHQFKWGAQGVYNDMSVTSLLYPNQVNAAGTYGLGRTDFHYFNPEGAMFVQDRWDHEGMVLNLGIRYDFFSVGDQIAAGEVDDRVKTQLSPRVGVSFPISERDVISFTYGRYFQVPNRSYIFEDRSSQAFIRGNPNLEPETTISYQAGIQHMFSSSVVGQFAVYFKDIFGLVTTQLEPAPDAAGSVPIYVNQDYASSRGFEASITKRFGHNFSAGIDYTFGKATGVASDEEETLRDSDELLFLPISEQPLAWDQRHTLNARLTIVEPLSRWAATFVWRYGSGLPFTPAQRLQKTLRPEDRNTGRLPSATTVDVQADKAFTMWGNNMNVYLQARNVLDAHDIRTLEPNNWPDGLASNEDLIDYRAYYSETGLAGGAYLGDDVDGDGSADWVALNDPRVFQEGRSIRVGFGVSY